MHRSSEIWQICLMVFQNLDLKIVAGGGIATIQLCYSIYLLKEEMHRSFFWFNRGSTK